jgi:hypothetical protein
MGLERFLFERVGVRLGFGMPNPYGKSMFHALGKKGDGWSSPFIKLKINQHTHYLSCDFNPSNCFWVITFLVTKSSGEV